MNPSDPTDATEADASPSPLEWLQALGAALLLAVVVCGTVSWVMASPMLS